MTKTNRLLVIFNTLLATILVLVLIQFSPSVANAGTTTIVACADKTTGALRIAYKACNKKENKVSWGATGPKGATGVKGPAGSSSSGGGLGFVVRDATGAIVDGVAYVNNPYVYLFRDGGMFTVNRNDGIFKSNVADPFYLNSNCEGSTVYPYADSKNETYKFRLYDINGEETGTFGPFKVGVIAHTGDVYELGYRGCELFSGNDNKYFELTAITQPSDLPAPLYLSAD